METYYGQVRSPADAIKLFEATRLGLLPRVQRRLSEKERQAIRPGSVFVWDEREAGMRRWTDGKSWSASRVAGSFLTYREMEGKRGNAFAAGRRAAGKTPDSGRGSDEDHDDGEPDGYRYKPDGLTKQSFSITNSTGQHLHLIAYCSRALQDLPLPSSDPSLRHIVPAKGMYPESSLAEATPAAAARAPVAQPPYMPHHHQPPPHHGYPPQYPHAGYAWPPSPVGTPPYSHGHYSYPQGPPAGGPPPGLHPYPPHPHHAHHPYPPNTGHDRSPLPPPQPHHYPQPQPHPHPHPHQHPHGPPLSQHQPQSQHQQHQQQQPQQQQLQHQQSPPMHPSQQQHPQLPAPQPPKMGAPAPQPYPPNQQHRSPPASHTPAPRLSLLDSPRSQHLQAQAREAVQIEPRLAPIDAARGQHSPLPAPGQLGQHQANGITPPSASSATTPGLTPSNLATSPIVRAPSRSPPRSAVSSSDGGGGGGRNGSLSVSTSTPASTRPTLQALLHPDSIIPPLTGSEPNSANLMSANPISAGSGISGGGSTGVNGAGTSGGGISSAGSSPRGNGSSQLSARPQGEDARTIGALNRNFF
ncbi:Gti1/Pac2 family-domain-containing protein [Chaetomium sp. MPI-SDFR-AT-0129]|nr:Gti1/Pac2 family-domain-containing protein [Chaetomium sp. MPI-SDFR-AT-0129]